MSITENRGVEEASAASTFHRQASTASMASLHQSFLDDEDSSPCVDVRSLPSVSKIEKSGRQAASANVATSPLPAPPSSSLPGLRSVHGHILSNTRQAFLDDDDDTFADSGDFAGATERTAANPAAATSKWDAHPHASSLPFSSDIKCEAHSHVGAAETRPTKLSQSPNNQNCRAERKLHEPSADFTRRYEGSSNPYLRAAALELANTPAGDDEAFPHSRRYSAPHASTFSCAQRDVDPVSPGLQRVPHASPQLSRPFHELSSAPFACNSGFSDPSPSSMAGKRKPPAPHRTTAPALRGYPLPARRHTAPSQAQRPRIIDSCTAAATNTPTLEQSIIEFGQLQLQEEAVHWYHRSNELEQELARVRECFERQSRLLAAQWQPKTTQKNAAATQTTNLAETSTGGGPTRNVSPSPLPFAAAAVASGASPAAASQSPAGHLTVLTSRSPDSLSRAYLYGQSADRAESDGSSGSGDENTGENGSGAALATLAEATMHYAVSRPQCSLEAAECTSAAGKVCRDADSRNVLHTRSERAEKTCAAGTAAPSSVARVSVGLQTEVNTTTMIALPQPPLPPALAPHLNSFVREEGESIRPAGAATPEAAATAASTQDTAPPCPSTSAAEHPAPSAILAKQYAEAVADVAALRVRLDVAERESQDLRETCVRQDLRCDDLETQLLAKEEQLLRWEQTASTATKADEETAQLLQPLVEALTELLRQARRAQRDYAVDGESRGTSDADDEERSRSTAEPVADSQPVETKSDDGNKEAATRLVSLVSQLQRTLTQVTQHYAAVQAELQVVRADRNELIGEQSEQVRQLQQQLLEKDTAQLQLMEQLNRLQEENAGAAATKNVRAARETSLGATSSSEAIDGSSSKDLSEQADTMVRNAALLQEVEQLKAQLAEAKAAAQAGQEAQRGVLTERLQQAHAELRETRLQAEDEYDRLSSTIERLRRELTDAKEALRVKELSLRIALRDASVSPLALVRAASDSAEHDGAAAAALLPPFSSSSSAQVGLLRSASHSTVREAATQHSTTSPSPHAPAPSPPPQPLPLLDLHTTEEESRDDNTDLQPTNLFGDASFESSTPPAATSQHPPQYFNMSAKFKDDGTLRTLPTSVPLEHEGEASQEGAVARPPASSQDRSSRGLTSSTGGVSYTTLSSLQRGRSDGSAEAADAPTNHTVPDRSLSASRSQPAPSTKVSPPSVRDTRARRSASTRAADVVSEEELPLPLPQRASMVPVVSDQTPPAQRNRREDDEAEGKENVRERSESSRKLYAGRGGSGIKGSSLLTPEERLRNLLSSPTEVFSRALRVEADHTPLAGGASLHGAERGDQNPSPGKPSVDLLNTLATNSTRLFDMQDSRATPSRTPVSLLSERTPPSSSGYGNSPLTSEVAARHAQASLRRQRDAWQQHETLFRSLLSSPSP